MRYLRRTILAAVLTAVLMALAVSGMFVTTAPRLVNLLLEPFSLFLMPGLVAALALAGAHDFSPHVVVLAAAGFYFVFFYMVQWWWDRHTRLAAGSAPHRSR